MRCIKKGTENWLCSEMCRQIRDEAIRTKRYLKGQIGLTSQKFTNGRDKADGYMARVWIEKGIHPEDETNIAFNGNKTSNSAAHTNTLCIHMCDLIAGEVLDSAMRELNINIAQLIARTAIWAPLEAHISCNRTAKSPNVRRKKAYENRGKTEAGLILDDNTYPNAQMKSVLKHYYRINPKNYETCHVWPDTCYDTRYHTCFANLVLLPRAIASFSDHNEYVQKVIQYRAFELFAWYPEGAKSPTKPENYPTEWFCVDIQI